MIILEIFLVLDKIALSSWIPSSKRPVWANGGKRLVSLYRDTNTSSEASKNKTVDWTFWLSSKDLISSTKSL